MLTLTMNQFFSSACLFLLCLRALPAVGEEPNPTISVIGEASVSIASDEIVIHASIESLAKTASQACKDNQEKSRRLLEFLKGMKINDQHIDADLLSITSIAPQESSSGQKGGNHSTSNDDPFGSEAELEQTASVLLAESSDIELFAPSQSSSKISANSRKSIRGLLSRGSIESIELNTDLHSSRSIVKNFES